MVRYTEPCDDIVNPTGVAEDSGSGPNGNNPPPPPVPPPPEFLAPDNHISEVVLTADREINIIPRQYFLEPNDIRPFFISLAEDPANRQQRINLFPENEADPSLSSTRPLLDHLRLESQAIWNWQMPYLANESLLKEVISDTYSDYQISPEKYGEAIIHRPRVSFESPRIDPAMKLVCPIEFKSEPRRVLNDLQSERQRLATFRSTYTEIKRVHEGKKFLDHTFAAKQPFFLDELNYLEASRFISVDVDTYSANYVEYPAGSRETDKTSLYRLYTQKKNPADSGLTDLETFLGPQEFCRFEDTIQKFTCGAIAEMSEANKNMVGSFDHYVKITINTNQSSRLAEFFDEYNMDKYFLELYTTFTAPGGSGATDGILQDTSRNGEVGFRPAMQVAQILDEDIVEKDEGIRATFYANDRAEITTVKYLDGIINFIERIKSADYNFFDKGIRKQDYPIPFEFGKSTESNILRFTDTIRSQIFMSKFKEQILTRDNIRSMEEIYEGKKSYSQIIGYRVAKHEVVDGQPGRKIQEFLFADSNDVRTIDFIDTQVFPGKKYIYRIHSINFVIGSEYEYETVNDDPTYIDYYNQVEFNTTAHVLPSCRIIEAPFFEKEVFMADKPPIFPQVNFVPNQGVANKMNILLLQNTDEIEEVPVEILETDSEHITNMINASRTTVKKDGTVLYGTDTLPEFFEVFRLSTPPENYKSFAEPELYKKLKATGKSVFFEDTDFEKNTNYYYMFRTIDNAGISNPTRIFRVKMVEYQSGIFMDLELYDFPTTEEQYSMDFTSALQICPAMTQKSLKVSQGINVDSREFFESAPDIGDIDIGNEPYNPVWDNQYRMRITSKTSGRKININFKFKKNKRVLTKLNDPEPIQSPNSEQTCAPESTSSQDESKIVDSTDTGPQEGQDFY